MSHMIKAKINISNDSILKRSLTKMGLTFEEGNFAISQYGQKETAQLKFENALGIQKQKDGTWMMVGDPYHCKNQKLRQYYGNQAKFDTELKTAYTIIETTEQLESMNFTCVENAEGTVNSSGKIRLVFQSLT